MVLLQASQPFVPNGSKSSADFELLIQYESNQPTYTDHGFHFIQRSRRM